MWRLTAVLSYSKNPIPQWWHIQPSILTPFSSTASLRHDHSHLLFLIQVCGIWIAGYFTEALTFNRGNLHFFHQTLYWKNGSIKCLYHLDNVHMVFMLIKNWNGLSSHCNLTLAFKCIWSFWGRHFPDSRAVCHQKSFISSSNKVWTFQSVLQHLSCDGYKPR